MNFLKNVRKSSSSLVWCILLVLGGCGNGLIYDNVSGNNTNRLEEAEIRAAAEQIALDESQNNNISLSVKSLERLIKNDKVVGYVVEFEPTGLVILPAYLEDYPIQFLSFTASYDELRGHPLIKSLTNRLYSTMALLGYFEDANENGIATMTSALEIENTQQIIQESKNRWDELLSLGSADRKVQPQEPVQTTSSGLSIPPSPTSCNPLVSSRWGQGSPWNAALSKITDTRLASCDPKTGRVTDPYYGETCGACISYVTGFALTPCKIYGLPVTGCVATAQGQLMYYWKWPNRFRWDLMAPRSDPWGQAALLLAEVGKKIGMNYGIYDGSGEHTVDAMASLRNNYSYDKHLRSINNTDDVFPDPNGAGNHKLYRAAKYEIENGRPISLNIDASEGGHSLIGDGFRDQDQLVHLNMGWNGGADGLYRLDTTFSAGGYKFHYDEMWIGIKPNSTYYEERKLGAIYCVDDNLGGDCAGSTGKIVNLRIEDRNDRISSLEVFAGWTITVCEHAHFQGICITFGSPYYDQYINAQRLKAVGLHDIISSIYVARTPFP